MKERCCLKCSYVFTPSELTEDYTCEKCLEKEKDHLPGKKYWKARCLAAEEVIAARAARNDHDQRTGKRWSEAFEAWAKLKDNEVE